MANSYFPVNRMFHVETPRDTRGGWYFEVRGGQPHGPYASRALAGTALELYLDALARTHPMP